VKLTMHEYFLKAEQIEHIAADIYNHLAARFAQEPTIAAWFHELALEEVQHAARVHLLSIQHHENRRLFAQVEQLDETLEDLYRDALLFRAEAQRGCWGGDLDKIRAQLVSMEEHFATLHALYMASSADPTIASFFRALAAQDRGHAKLLARTWPQPRSPTTDQLKAAAKRKRSRRPRDD